jgi:hypothetical protein
LFYIFQSYVTVFTDICNCLIFLVNCSFYHHIIFANKEFDSSWTLFHSLSIWWCQLFFIDIYLEFLFSSVTLMFLLIYILDICLLYRLYN